MYGREAFRDGDGGTSSTADYRLGTAKALYRLPKEVPTSGSKPADLMRALADEADASRAAPANAGEKVERQRKLIFTAEKSTNNALNDVASLHGQLAVAGTGEAELLSRASVASSQIARATAQLCQPRDMIVSQSRELASIMQLKMSIESLENTMTLY